MTEHQPLLQRNNMGALIGSCGPCRFAVGGNPDRVREKLNDHCGEHRFATRAALLRLMPHPDDDGLWYVEVETLTGPRQREVDITGGRTPGEALDAAVKWASSRGLQVRLVAAEFTAWKEPTA